MTIRRSASKKPITSIGLLRNARFFSTHQQHSGNASSCTNLLMVYLNILSMSMTSSYSYLSAMPGHTQPKSLRPFMISSFLTRLPKPILIPTAIGFTIAVRALIVTLREYNHRLSITNALRATLHGVSMKLVLARCVGISLRLYETDHK